MFYSEFKIGHFRELALGITLLDQGLLEHGRVGLDPLLLHLLHINLLSQPLLPLGVVDQSQLLGFLLNNFTLEINFGKWKITSTSIPGATSAGGFHWMRFSRSDRLSATSE